jgi:hypothetical protein
MYFSQCDPFRLLHLCHLFSSQTVQQQEEECNMQEIRKEREDLFRIVGSRPVKTSITHVPSNTK